MTAIGIFGIAYGSNWERYDSWHTPPEVKTYIESVAPDSVPHEYADGGKFFKVETTELGSTVTASPQVVLPTGEARQFSYWLLRPDPQEPTQKYAERPLEVLQGEYGLVGLYYGVGRKPIRWPGFDEKAFDRFVHIMMSHAPSWDLPHPQPWVRKG